jgi:hypothetical protein
MAEPGTVMDRPGTGLARDLAKRMRLRGPGVGTTEHPVTAYDAYMRDYQIVVPRDCVATNTRREAEFALEQNRLGLKGRLPHHAASA